MSAAPPPSAGEQPLPGTTPPAAPVQPPQPATAGQEPAFEAASGFAGARAGFFFGTGEHGTGYYRDQRPVTGRQPALKKGLIPKKKSIVPGLRVAAGVTKKAKPAAAPPASEYLAEMQRYRQQSCATESSSGHPLVK